MYIHLYTYTQFIYYSIVYVALLLSDKLFNTIYIYIYIYIYVYIYIVVPGAARDVGGCRRNLTNQGLETSYL